MNSGPTHRARTSAALLGLTLVTAACAAKVASGDRPHKDGRPPSIRAASESLTSGQDVHGMACASADLCFATVVTGTRATAPNEVSRIMQWDGRMWTLLGASPGTSIAGWTLSGMACGSPTMCVAVGGSDGPAALMWNGTDWRRTPVPIPAPPPSSGAWGADGRFVLNAVACYSATQCVAVGDVYFPTVDTPNLYLMAVRWDGTAWVDTRIDPGDSRKELSSIACPGSDDCTAVGTSENGVEGFNPQPLIEHWNGHHWSNVNIASPANGFDPARLSGISCPSKTWCIAVGSGTKQAPPTDGLSGDTANTAAAFLFSSGTWTMESFVAGGSLSEVACQAVAECVAVGGFSDQVDPKTRYQFSLVDAYNGNWAAVTPSGASTSGSSTIALDRPNHYLVGGTEVVGTVDTKY